MFLYQYFKKFFVFLILGITFGMPIFAKEPLPVGTMPNPGSAILYFSPSSGRFSPGEEFWVDVVVNSGFEYINAVAAYFAYPADKVKVVDIKREGSVMTLFSEQTSENGMVKISGGKPTPGFSGISKIASVGFRSSEAGSVSLSFFANSAVLTDKGNKNILDYSMLAGAEYSIGDDKKLIPSFVENIESSVSAIFALPIILIVITLLILGLFGGAVLILKGKIAKMEKKLKV